MALPVRTASTTATAAPAAADVARMPRLVGNDAWDMMSSPSGVQAKRWRLLYYGKMQAAALSAHSSIAVTGQRLWYARVLRAPIKRKRGRIAPRPFAPQ